MEQWDKSFYISSVAGSNNGSSIVVMSKGIIFFCDIYHYLTVSPRPHLLCDKNCCLLLLACCIYISITLFSLQLQYIRDYSISYLIVYNVPT